MESALQRALDPDSPYFELLLRIFSKLPVEDIARCRTLSRSALRLLYDDNFLRRLPIHFGGFIITPSPTSDFHYSILNWHTFSNIPTGPRAFRIVSSHEDLLLTTVGGMCWRIVNPLTGMAVSPPCVFYRDDFVVSAAIHRERGGSDYKVFFLVCRGREGTWMVTFSKKTSDSVTEIKHVHRRLSGDPLSYDFRLGGAVRPGVFAGFVRHYFVCVLFPTDKQVWVVSCKSPDNWLFELPGGDAEGKEYGLCWNGARKVHVTCVSGDDVILWRLDLDVVNGSVDMEPKLELLHRLHFDGLHLPGLRVEHYEGVYVFLRHGKFIQPYNIRTSSMEAVIELPHSMREETGSDDDKWPPVFAFSSYLGLAADPWQW